MDLAAAGEEQHRDMGVGDEHRGDDIVALGRHAGAATAAATLCAIGRDRHALDVSALRHRDDHVLALDQVLDVGLVLELDDLGATRRGVGVADRDQFLTHQRVKLGTRGQQLEEAGDVPRDLLQLLGDLVALQPGQALQAQLEDGARLNLG